MSWDTGGAEGGNWTHDLAVEPTGGGVYGTDAVENDHIEDENDVSESGGGGFNGACYNCGGEGHSKQNCPEPPKSRACFNCGQEGHSKAECTNERVEREFTGQCRLCEQTGHRAIDCPTAPPRVCNNCREEGHSILECKNPRHVDYSNIESVTAEDAWAQLITAAEERDLDDVKEAAQKYFKACPEATYVEIEDAFRKLDVKVYLIAIEKELSVTYTNMDLQGNLDKKYTVTWRFSDKPARPKENDVWPSTPEENLTRLADAGTPVDRGIPKCSNCNELGHTSKNCSQERMENADRAIVSCYNCSEVGHRMRDCPNPRPDRFACKPRNPATVTCKVCDEKGHFAKDCPQGGGRPAQKCFNCGEEGHRSSDCTNEKKLICRNCDAEGHQSRECPKPRDYSRVQCQNCKQMGHTKVRCKEPIVDDEGTGGPSGYGGADGGHSGEAHGDTGGDLGSTPVAAGEWEGGQDQTSGW